MTYRSNIKVCIGWFWSTFWIQEAYIGFDYQLLHGEYNLNYFTIQYTAALLQLQSESLPFSTHYWFFYLQTPKWNRKNCSNTMWWRVCKQFLQSLWPLWQINKAIPTNALSLHHRTRFSSMADNPHKHQQPLRWGKKGWDKDRKN